MILKILSKSDDLLATNDYLGFGFKTDDLAYNAEFIGNFALNSNFKNFLPAPEKLLEVKDIESIYIDELTALYEIPLLKEPNQSFDIYVNGESFNLDIRTNTDDKTFASIWQGEKMIIEGAPVSNTAVNLAYFSHYEKGVFFFLYNKNVYIENYNFTQFNSNLRLFYGVI